MGQIKGKNEENEVKNQHEQYDKIQMPYSLENLKKY